MYPNHHTKVNFILKKLSFQTSSNGFTNTIYCLLKEKIFKRFSTTRLPSENTTKQRKWQQAHQPLLQIGGVGGAACLFIIYLFLNAQIVFKTYIMKSYEIAYS